MKEIVLLYCLYLIISGFLDVIEEAREHHC